MYPILRLLEGTISEHVSSFEGTSQYTQGGTSTCGLAALNAVRIILGREKQGINGVELLQAIASKALIDEAVAICATWSSQLHLEVDDIKSLPLFDDSLALSFSEYNQADSDNFMALLKRLQETSEPDHSPRSRIASAVVITRPPEILAVFHIPMQSSKHPSIFVVFDSHPRPNKGTKGASFIFFPSLEVTNQYISGLLQVDPNLRSAFRGMQWQAQLLGHYSGHVFLARNHYDADVNPMRPIYDANMNVLELKSRLADAEERIRTLSSDNSRLHGRLTELEGTLSLNRSPPSTGSNPKMYWVPPLRQSPISSRHRSPPRIAGPATYHKPILANDKPGQPSVSKDQERVDAALAARLHREQDKELASFELARRTQKELDDEDSELQSQLRRLQEMAQVLFLCRICFEEHPMDSVAQIDTCRHMFCRECMRSLVSSKLEEHRYPIVCPVCQLDSDAKDLGIINGYLVEQLGLSEAQHAVWIELELAEFSISLNCPKCHRSTFVDLEDHTDMKLLLCPLPDCRHVWCKLCTRPVETGTQHSCDGTLELDNLMKMHGWCYCPGCRTPTEKRHGCNHMTCIARGCNTHFCYLCGQNIIRSAGGREIDTAIHAHYTQCRLFEDVPERNAQ